MKNSKPRVVRVPLVMSTSQAGPLLRPKSARTIREAETRDDMQIADVAAADIENVLQSLKTSREGLTEEEASERLDLYGFNEVAHERPPRWYAQLLHSFNNPFILLLIGLATLSYLTGDTEATVIISVMVLISGLLRFFQEFRSSKAAEKLKAMVSTTATVSRRDVEKSMPAERRNVVAAMLPPRGLWRREVPLKLL